MAGELQPFESVRADLIAETLDISSTPVREALQALRVEGFLTLIPRRGFTVAPLVGEDIRDLYKAQSLIAGELAARAAERATDDDIAELQALHFELLAAANRGAHEMLEEKNHEFHRHINVIAGSQKLRWVLGLVSRYVPRRFYAQIPGWPKATSDDHAGVLDAIRQHDAEGARREMQGHIVKAGELLVQHFDSRVAVGTARGTEIP